MLPLLGTVQHFKALVLYLAVLVWRLRIEKAIEDEDVRAGLRECVIISIPWVCAGISIVYVSINVAQLGFCMQYTDLLRKPYY